MTNVLQSTVATPLTDQIVTDLVAKQTPHRLLHIFGVLQTGLTLASIYGGNIEKITLAALLHDCAKHIGRNETLRLADDGLINLNQTDREHPAIWHGAVGANIARTLYGVTDTEILESVEYHTLGCEKPSLTLQILMCADFCEPTREFDGIDEIRQLIRKDLRKGLLAILNRKIEDLIKKDQKPHPGIYKTIKHLET